MTKYSGQSKNVNTESTPEITTKTKIKQNIVFNQSRAQAHWDWVVFISGISVIDVSIRVHLNILYFSAEVCMETSGFEASDIINFT